MNQPLLKKPAWLKLHLPTAPEYEALRRLIKASGLTTVCQEARCPNQWECFSNKTATFLILGNICTRNCSFCAVKSGLPQAPDPTEPKQVAKTVFKMCLKHVVVTSVTRDDLPDGGAAHFAATIQEIRKHCQATIEVLIPDFQGDSQALQTVISVKPDIISHNIETVPRLYPTVRPQAKYQRSLDLLTKAQKLSPSIPTKSGLMLGLGEKKEEVQKVLEDLYGAGCQFLTIGQYLQPSKKHLPVHRFIPPDEFSSWQSTATKIGFKKIASAPFVRSSYKASEF